MIWTVNLESDFAARKVEVKDTMEGLDEAFLLHVSDTERIQYRSKCVFGWCGSVKQLASIDMIACLHVL